MTPDISDDCLHTLEIVGKILLFTPITVSVLLAIFAILSGDNIGIDGGTYSVGLMMFAGFFILIYVSIQYFKRARG